MWKNFAIYKKIKGSEVVYSFMWQAPNSLSLFRPKFGKLFETSGEEYLDAIDKESPDVVIVMHLYQPVSLVMYCVSDTFHLHFGE